MLVMLVRPVSRLKILYSMLVWTGVRNPAGQEICLVSKTVCPMDIVGSFPGRRGSLTIDRNLVPRLGISRRNGPYEPFMTCVGKTRFGSNRVYVAVLLISERPAVIFLYSFNMIIIETYVYCAVRAAACTVIQVGVSLLKF
jgi:hypothetical protein